MKAILLLAILFASPACADMAAGSFARACRSAPGSAGDQLCAAYVNGLAAGILVDQAARTDGQAICLPDGVSTSDLRQVLTDYLGDQAIASLPAGGFITAALQARYRCKGPIGSPHPASLTPSQ